MPGPLTVPEPEVVTVTVRVEARFFFPASAGAVATNIASVIISAAETLDQEILLRRIGTPFGDDQAAFRTGLPRGGCGEGC